MNIWSAVKLKKEAILLDSKRYIIKAFFAVMAAYMIAIKNPVLKLDTISVLFGLMLTLEPVTLTGIKNGLNQICATVLGALSTAVIIYSFQALGIAMVWIIALSMAFTLYVSLKIDWRAVSPVAIFTSIYMTQYIQKTTSGEPSIWLTFRLRLCALGTGVTIAIIFNFIFALISYRRMMNNRVVFLLEMIKNSVNGMAAGIKNNDINSIIDVKNSFPPIFNNIDWVSGLFEDMKKEYNFKGKFVGFKKDTIIAMQNIVLLLRNVTHLNYDIAYVLIREEASINKLKLESEKAVTTLNFIIEELEAIKVLLVKDAAVSNVYEKALEIIEVEGRKDKNYKEPFNRVLNNLQDILSMINSIKIEMKKIPFENRR